MGGGGEVSSRYGQISGERRREGMTTRKCRRYGMRCGTGLAGRTSTVYEDTGIRFLEQPERSVLEEESGRPGATIAAR